MNLNTETRSLGIRLLALTAMVGVLGALVVAEPAWAAPCREIWVDYYEEPELINLCGTTVNTCTQIIREGCQTHYSVAELGDCCGGGGGPLCEC